MILKASPEIPLGAWCYIKRVPAYGNHPDIARKIEGQCFTWYGTDKKYRLTKNVKL